MQNRDLESAVAYDGEHPLSVVEEETPDVIVLDINLPGVNGLEMLRRVERDRPHTEVIILTGPGSERERHRALELGAFAYLNEPVDIDVLAHAIKRASIRLWARESSGGRT